MEKANDDKEDKNSFIVTPWDVSGKIDYEKLVNQFGTELIDKPLLEKFKRVTGKNLHPWMERNIFFTHRSLDKFLDAYERGDPVFLYTGRGPSSDVMHVGHLIPFLFTKWLQDVFDCPLVIQISDEEKAAFKGIDYKESNRMGYENAKEIISCGFNPKKTFIFNNREYRLKCPEFEKFSNILKEKANIKSIQSIFGLDESSSVAKYDWPIFQSAAAFYQAYPHIFKGRPAYCLVPHAIDQDPYFRLSRDLASKCNFIKQCNIECTFIPPLTGQEGKMSSSVSANATLFLDGTLEQVRNKIMNYCASGADPDPEIHKIKGGDCNKDMAYQYLRYFELDNSKLEKIRKDFSEGAMSSTEIKEYLVKKFMELLITIQENRKKVTDEVLKDFYSMKPMELPKPKQKQPIQEEKNLYNLLESQKIKYEIKYHEPISNDEQFEELSRSLGNPTILFGYLLKNKEEFIFYISSERGRINLKNLSKKLKIKSLKLAEIDLSTSILQINPKLCPTPFSLMNDKEKKIKKIIIDDDISKEKPVSAFPMRVDASCCLNFEDFLNHIKLTGYEYEFY